MMISYLLTLYNKEKVIKDTILSISKQLGNFEKEIIIIDDGSTDNSLKVAQEALSNLANITSRIASQKNSGPSVALNAGIKLCTGDFVYLGDGDDYIYPDSTISMLAVAEKYKAKLVRGRHSNNFPFDKNHYDCRIDIISNSIDEAIKFFPIGYGTLVDRNLLLQCGGCDERVFIQDYSLALRLAPFTEFVAFNKLVAHHIAKQQTRLSSSKLNENYDTAKARMLFCTETKLSEQQKILSLKIQLRKSSSWLRKTNFFGWILSKHLARNILAKILPSLLMNNYEAVMRESLEVYNTKSHF